MPTPHFGTFFYQTRVKKLNKANLGDEIQGFPGLQFMPFIDELIDRDNTLVCMCALIHTNGFVT